MSGREYLEDIRSNLESGSNQWRMGENVLRAFGYVRRRKTAIDEINKTLAGLGVVAEPPVSPDMPLRSPYIRFTLSTADGAAIDAPGDGQDISGPMLRRRNS